MCDHAKLPHFSPDLKTQISGGLLTFVRSYEASSKKITNGKPHKLIVSNNPKAILNKPYFHFVVLPLAANDCS